MSGCRRDPWPFFPASSSLIRYTGRVDARAPNAQRLSWPGTQISARFTGPWLRAVLIDTPIEDETRETDWITVVIDDDEPRTFALAEGKHVYPLAIKRGPGVHRARIWKRTEAEVGVVTFLGFQVENGERLVESERMPKRSLEFVGDSVTAGYGNEGADGTCHWSASKENNYLTYGAVAARALGAAFTCTAWSGKGLTRNYEARDVETLPQIYTRIIPTEPAAGFASALPAPNAVILNLGTNDVFAGEVDAATFARAYFQLVKTLRARYPNALIVLALGPMLADDYPRPNARTHMRSWMQKALRDFRAQLDDNIDFIEFWIDPKEGVGCDFHPNTKTHARLGAELAALLRARLGW